MQKKKNLDNILKNFEIIIFDLDDTLISISKYDELVFKKICDVIIKIKKKKVLDKLKTLRKLELKSFKIKKSNVKILENLKTKKKILYLVTNGNKKRQMNKIKNLGILKYFKKIYVMDGNKKKFKPSTSSLSSLKKIIRSKKAVMIGDSKIDEQFAKNLKVKYIKFTTS